MRILSVALFLLLLFILFPFVTSLQKVNADGKVVINEILAHPGDGNKEWIEFYNPDNVDLSDYFLDDDISFTDDSGNSSKKSLAGVLQNGDSNHPYIETSAMFNNDGDFVVLFDKNGSIIDQYQYTKDPGVDVAIGRSPDGTGSFQILEAATQGSPNGDPQPPATPTSQPSPTATHTPVPVHTPTPTRIPTPTKLPTPIKVKIPPDGQMEQTITTDPAIDDATTGMPINISSIPTSILGVSSIAAQQKTLPTQRELQDTVLVKSSTAKINSFSIALIDVIIGGVLLLVCGILMLWKMKTKKQVL